MLKKYYHQNYEKFLLYSLGKDKQKIYMYSDLLCFMILHVFNLPFSVSVSLPEERLEDLFDMCRYIQSR